MNILNLDVILALAILSGTVMQLVNKLVKPIWERLKLDTFWYTYLAGLLAAPVVWFTEMNAFAIFEGFGDWRVYLGRGLTTLAGALGPSLVYDLWFNKPKPPED